MADESGQIAYRVYDGPVSGGRVYRVAARAGATPEDLSLALDALAPPAPDDWVSIAPDGRWLLLGTERFDPDCLGWPCLAVVPADLSAGEVVRIGAEVVHPDFQAAIAAGGGLIVYPKGGGPHEQDLWAIRRQGQGWGAPLLLTGASPYAYHALPALDVSGARVLFECGARPYGEEGTAICEVGTEGTGFQVVLTPADAPPGQPSAGALRHPAYTPDGGVVFAATWDGSLWRLPPGAAAPDPAGPGFENDNSPCALPDGRIASLWLGRPDGPGLHELKVMAPDGATFVMLVSGVDIEDVSCGG